MPLILKLRTILQEEKPNYPINYAIPNLFNLFGYNSLAKLPNGEELVNPYDFLISLIDTVLLKNYSPTETMSLSMKNNVKSTSWLKEAVFYSMLIRTSTSWDHDRNGFLDENNIYHLKESGTFIKTLMILPLLLEMGVNAIYLLPISKYSLKNKKGDIGSPYSVSNFFKLDENLNDPILNNRLTLEEQFSVLVKACHILNIRVLIDIIPRTNSTESDLILTNPEWFYWINTSDLKIYKPPYISSIKDETVPPFKKYMKDVYESDSVKEHLKLFKDNPKKQDSLLWEKVLKETAKNPNKILETIDKYFNLTVAPAFSDHINDIQPPWTDITFFRMYLDHPKDNIKYLVDKNIPPYILFDTIKSNLHPGKIPNKELWETLSNIIPYYQKTFGIDGARIDMGHALPDDLVKNIIKNAKEIDPSFIFIAEELNPDNALKAKSLGYDMIIGNAFSFVHDVYNLKTHHFMLNTQNLPILQFALGETHDTPRLASREGEMILSKFITVMNMFLPNAVPFINSGQEIYERQAMNLGINPRENELYMLNNNDPYYGKLALFDKFSFHYLNNMSHDIKDNLKLIKPIRKKYLKAITNKNKYIPITYIEGKNPIGFAYELKDELLFILGNPYYNFGQNIKINLNALRTTYNIGNEAFLLYGMHENDTRKITEFDENNNIYFLAGPGEIKIFTIKKEI